MMQHVDYRQLATNLLQTFINFVAFREHPVERPHKHIYTHIYIYIYYTHIYVKLKVVHPAQHIDI